MPLVALHPGVRSWYRLRAVVTSAFLFGCIYMLLFPFLAFDNPPNIPARVFLAGVALAFLVASEVYARLAYRHARYEMGQQGLVIQRGIVWQSSLVIPYERIQSVEIVKGIIGGVAGFSSVRIWMAGPVGQYAPAGWIPGVAPAEAESIRTQLLSKSTPKSGQQVAAP